MFVETPGGSRIHVAEMGPHAAAVSTVPMLLLHGFMGGIDAWSTRATEALSAGRRVLAVDLPGHGKSDAPPTPERYGIQRVVDDLTAVLESAGIDQADWIGYSMGGRIALAAAVLRPGRVRRLVLESASPGLDAEVDRLARRQHDETLAGELVAGDFAEFVENWMNQPLFATQARLGPLWSAAERTRRLRQDPLALAGCLRGLGTGSQPSFWKALRTVTPRTLLITGALDGKFTAVGRRMAEQLPDAELCVFGDVGHAVHAEDPEGWAKRVKHFLDG